MFLSCYMRQDDKPGSTLLSNQDWLAETGIEHYCLTGQINMIADSGHSAVGHHTQARLGIFIIESEDWKHTGVQKNLQPEYCQGWVYKGNHILVRQWTQVKGYRSCGLQSKLQRQNKRGNSNSDLESWRTTDLQLQVTLMIWGVVISGINHFVYGLTILISGLHQKFGVMERSSLPVDRVGGK